MDTGYTSVHRKRKTKPMSYLSMHQKLHSIIIEQIILYRSGRSRYLKDAKEKQDPSNDFDCKIVTQIILFSTFN